MTQLDRPSATLDRQAKRRAPSSRLADLGDRIARTFAPATDAGHAPPWEANTEAHYPLPDDGDAQWDEPAAPFPVVRSGYDRKTVDAYIGELEREIDELRARPSSSENAVSDEIKRIGEQTAAILQTAHQQAHDTRMKAQTEADKCLSDAAANAIAMNEDAKQKLRHLDSETDAVWHERVRLIEDVRTVATALFTLAEEASDRFPSEEEKRASFEPVAASFEPVAAQPVEAPVAAQPAVEPSDSAAAAEPEDQASVAGGDDDVRGLDDGGDRGPFVQP